MITRSLICAFNKLRRRWLLLFFNVVCKYHQTLETMKREPAPTPTIAGPRIWFAYPLTETLPALPIPIALVVIVLFTRKII